MRPRSSPQDLDSCQVVTNGSRSGAVTAGIGALLLFGAVVGLGSRSAEHDPGRREKAASDNVETSALLNVIQWDDTLADATDNWPRSSSVSALLDGRRFDLAIAEEARAT